MILKAIREEEGRGVALILSPSENSHGEEALLLSPGEWKRLTKETPLAPGDELDEERYDSLRAAAERTSALRTAAALLTSGDKSAAALTRKLRQKGFSDGASRYAVSFLAKKGYLNEADACLRYAESALRTKKYGRVRIVEYLLAHGYGREEAKAAADSLPEEEILDALRTQLERRFPELDSSGGSPVPPELRAKAVRSLMRLGFTYEEISAVFLEKRVKRGTKGVAF